MCASLGWPRAPPPEHLDVWQAGLQTPLNTENIFRFFLESQINWKCFTSVGFFFKYISFSFPALRSAIM